MYVENAVKERERKDEKENGIENKQRRTEDQ
jgi:hypothetical protein